MGCQRYRLPERIQGLNCQKISGGLTSAYSLSLSLHTGNSASLTTAGVETDPPPGVSQGIFFGGVEQTTGGFNPPTLPAIQTLNVYSRTAALNCIGGIMKLSSGKYNYCNLCFDIER
jgi:hypothetical protein